MPPFYDIYGLSNQRDKETIDKFINYFCYRDDVEYLGEDSGIFVRSSDECNEDFIPLSTLTDVIEWGLNNPTKGFSFYLHKGFKTVKGLILTFTYDSKMVFGVSIEYNEIVNGKLINNASLCDVLANKVSEVTNSYKTLIGLELPPPRSEEELDQY